MCRVKANFSKGLLQLDTFVETKQLTCIFRCHLGWLSFRSGGMKVGHVTVEWVTESQVWFSRPGSRIGDEGISESNNILFYWKTICGQNKQKKTKTINFNWLLSVKLLAVFIDKWVVMVLSLLTQCFVLNDIISCPCSFWLCFQFS